MAYTPRHREIVKLLLKEGEITLADFKNEKLKRNINDNTLFMINNFKNLIKNITERCFHSILDTYRGSRIDLASKHIDALEEYCLACCIDIIISINNMYYSNIFENIKYVNIKNKHVDVNAIYVGNRPMSYDLWKKLENVKISRQINGEKYYDFVVNELKIDIKLRDMNDRDTLSGILKDISEKQNDETLFVCLIGGNGNIFNQILEKHINEHMVYFFDLSQYGFLPYKPYKVLDDTDNINIFLNYFVFFKNNNIKEIEYKKFFIECVDNLKISEFIKIIVFDNTYRRFPISYDIELEIILLNKYIRDNNIKEKIEFCENYNRPTFKIGNIITRIELFGINRNKYDIELIIQNANYAKLIIFIIEDNNNELKIYFENIRQKYLNIDIKIVCVIDYTKYIITNYGKHVYFINMCEIHYDDKTYSNHYGFCYCWI